MQQSIVFWKLVLYRYMPEDLVALKYILPRREKHMMYAQEHAWL